jgi:hypothetical protein
MSVVLTFMNMAQQGLYSSLDLVKPPAYCMGHERIPGCLGVVGKWLSKVEDVQRN